VLGRVKPGVSAASAQAELSQITGDLARTYPKDYPPDARALSVPLQTYFVGSSDKTLWLLLGAVGLLLLIACANVASLVLARAIGRRKELALRAAIGASRLRLIRQMVTESLVLAAAGGAAGLVLAIWAIEGLKRLGVDSIPRIAEVSLDMPVLLFALVVATFCGLLFGAAPALEASRVDVNEALKDAARGTESRRRVRQIVVIGELAGSRVCHDLRDRIVVEEPGALAGLESRLRSKEHDHDDGQRERPKPEDKRATRRIQPRVTGKGSRVAGCGGSGTGRSSSPERQL